MLVWPNNKVKNLFGIKRYGRAQGIELGLIISNLPNSLKWSTCKKDVKTCVHNMKTQQAIVNPTPYPTICGDIGIERSTPVPWAWSSYNVITVSKVLRVNVKCS